MKILLGDFSAKLISKDVFKLRVGSESLVKIVMIMVLEETTLPH